MDIELLYTTANLLLLGPGILMILLASSIVRALHRLLPGGLRFVIFKGLSIEIKKERYGSSYYSWLLKRYLSKRTVNSVVEYVDSSAPLVLRLLVIFAYALYIYFKL